MKRAWIVSLIYLALPFSAQAISLFSGNGFGELIPPPDAGPRGMGGAGVAHRNSTASELNPALLSSLKETTLSLTLNSELCEHEDSVRAKTSSFRLSGLRFSLPLPYRVMVGASVQRRFDMDFDIASVSGIADTIAYTRSIAGRGGIYSTSICLAREVFDLISLGGSFNFLSGYGIEEWKTEFNNPEVRPAVDSLRHEYSGSNSTFGVLARIGDAFSLGVSLTTPTTLKGELEVLSPGGTRSEERTYRLPLTYALGAAYVREGTLLIASGLVAYPWGNVSLNGQPRTRFSNTNRFALGAELLPAKDELARLFRKLPLRIGYSNSPWYFETARGRIGEQLLTFGSTLFLPAGQIDLSFELGERKGGDLRERVWRGGITLSGRERW